MKRFIFFAALLLTGIATNAQNRFNHGSAGNSSYRPDYQNRNRGNGTVEIYVRRPGDLNSRLTLSDRRYVTELIIEGTLNDDDYRVLNELGKRTKMINANNREVNAYIDIDLFNTQYVKGDRVSDIIPKNAFSNCSNLRAVVLPRQVVEICDYAFQNCKMIENITLPEGLQVIGTSAFRGAGLTDIYMPPSVSQVGSWAFADTKIERAFIGAYLKSCPSNVFDNYSLKDYEVEEGSPLYSSIDGVLCTADGSQMLKYPRGRSGSFDMPEGITSFSTNAFSYNQRITGITLPESITSLPEGAFEECNALSFVNIPSQVSVIPKNAFRGCKALVDFTIPDNITYIGEGAFRACKGMRSITFPKNLKSIDEQAFYYCEKLLTAEVPASVISIGSKAFYHCDAMTELVLKSTTPPTMEKINDNHKKITIVVPQGAEEAYSKLEALKKFKVIGR